MKKTFKSMAVLVLVTLALVSCCGQQKAANKNALSLWNDDAASKQALIEYVKTVTDEKSPDFIPVKDRIATFDMDGTFIGELAPSYFEYNMLEYRVLDDPSYKDLAPADVKEAAQEIRDFVRNGKKLPDHFDMKHAHAAAKAYAGMTLKEFDDYVKAYGQKPANGFKGMLYGQTFYKPMLEVFDYLNANGFTCYVVSGSDRFICRSLTESIGIEPNRIIGMDVVLKSSKQGDEDGVNYTMEKDEILLRTDQLIIKNLKTNKVKQIAQEIGKVPVISFGNSGGDAAMHNYTLSNKQYKSIAFMLIADDEAQDHAKREKGLALGEDWKKAGYVVISMRDDWKTIYGTDVEKTDFTF